MSSAYYAAVQKHLPKATLVFDRFHIVKLMNDKLTQLRRELYRKAKDGLHKNVLKGTRWLLQYRDQECSASASRNKTVKHVEPESRVRKNPRKSGRISQRTSTTSGSFEAE